MSRVVDQALAFQRRAVKAEAERDEARAEADRLRAERDDALSTVPTQALVQQNADLLREAERLTRMVMDERAQHRQECADLRSRERRTEAEVERLREALPDAIYHGLHTRGIEDGEATRLTEGILRDLGIADRKEKQDA